MTKKFIALALIILALSFTGCTTTAPSINPGAVDQFRETFEGVCTVWQKIRDAYPKIKEGAIVLNDLGGLDVQTWEAFVWIDDHAKELDRWLALFCDAQNGAANAHIIAAEKQGVDWNTVGAMVLKAAAFAIQQGLL